MNACTYYNGTTEEYDDVKYETSGRACRYCILSRSALTASNILRTLVMKILLCKNLRKKKILSKMDPEQGSRKGSNSILLPTIISKFDSFSTEILPKMETSNSGLEKLFV